MAEPWSVRRARNAGEALRPAKKATSEDYDDEASSASRDARSAERSRRAASAAPAPRLGPIVALVTRRDRVQHVYCKRTNETVPCVAIRLADDTFDGLRVVLWRAHAVADVGANRTNARSLLAPHVSAHETTRITRRPPRPVSSHCLTDNVSSPLPDAAGVGDVIEAMGLRARWNAYRDEPELTSGYGTKLVARATASALLRHRSASRDEDAPRVRSGGSESRDAVSRAPRGATAFDALASWALEHRMGVLRASALAEARRARRSGDSVGARGGFDEDPLRSAAETSGAVPCFSGRVVHASASASRGRRASDGGATKRVTAWVARDSTGSSTEVTLRAMPAEKAEALASRLPGSAVRCFNFLVFARADARGRRAYALVQRDEDAGTERDGDALASSELCVLPEGDARAEDVAARTRGTRRASAEAPSLRSLADFETGFETGFETAFETAFETGFETASGRVRAGADVAFAGPPAKPSAETAVGWLSSGGARDASVVVVRARVVWVRLPRATRASRAAAPPSRKRRRAATRGFPATRAETADSMLTRGCVLCLRALAPDPADGDRVIRQCGCHGGRANAVGWVWRALELGLTDAPRETVGDAVDVETDDDGRGSGRGVPAGRAGVDRVENEDHLANVRVARVDASLVPRLLLGADAAAAAAAAARDGARDDSGVASSPPRGDARARRGRDDAVVDHLSLATAAINALAAGPARNATPIAWHLRAPPPDSNGVRFADGAPLEVVDFEIVDVPDVVSAGRRA